MGQKANLWNRKGERNLHGKIRIGARIDLQSVHDQMCPNCGDRHLNVYFSDQTDDKLGIWFESCNLKAYYCGETSILIN